jgi:hypothetical protein
MPTTPKGITYPGPKYPPQISTDMSQLGQDAYKAIDVFAMSRYTIPETITAPTSYTASAANGNGESVEFTAPSPTVSAPLVESPIFVGYIGQWKKSTTATLNAAIFINVNNAGLTQLKQPVNNGAPVVNELTDASAFSAPGFFGKLATTDSGLAGAAGGAADTTFPSTRTFILPPFCFIWGFQPGGSQIHVEIKFKASAGNVLLGTRYLFAGTFKTQG